MPKMAGVCSYNFTIGYLFRYPEVVNDGQNRLKGRFGSPIDLLYGYKNER